MNEAGLTDDFDDLALRVLHGMADAADPENLSRLLSASAENRQRFLQHAALHGMLAQEARAGAFADNSDAFFREIEKPHAKPARILRFWIPAAAAAALVIGWLMVIPLLTTTASAALDRVIATMNENHDRAYRIEVVDQGTGEVLERSKGPFPPGNYLDQSTLWLRGPHSFVLSQKLPNGETRIMGSDGTENWSLRGEGPVHVSPDANRFGGRILAERTEIAFLDLHSQLDQLQRLYQIEWLDHTSREAWKLRGVRRSADQGGPREIELWFDPDTGLLGRMILRDLPRRSGGPRSIAISLLSTDPLPADFFSHTFHHEPGRPAITE